MTAPSGSTTSTGPTGGLRLRIEVAGRPDPMRLRAAIAARLAGRPWAGPEGPIADLVVAATTQASATVAGAAEGGGPWR